ncbi:MAG: hypothetical protein Q4G25_06655 [Paracoccus sp. (in: a-proteobacteria)]|nr:hypothetical protein [Paracoccus sp. (in: a-proteobacteria)]
MSARMTPPPDDRVVVALLPSGFGPLPAVRFPLRCGGVGNATGFGRTAGWPFRQRQPGERA